MKRAIASGCVTGAFLGLAVIAAVACDDKKNAVTLAPSASSLAPSTPPPPGAKVVKFAIDASGTTSILLEAPKEKFKATTNAAAGSLDVDLMNIAASRGEVKIDLTTLTTRTFEDPKDNTAQTGHARTWLEVSDGESGPLDAKVKEANRYAVYAIRSIENVAPNADLSKVPVTKDGSDDARRVTMTTKGELLVHGHKVDRESEIDVVFRYDPGAAPDKPREMTIKSRKPLRVVLGEHDVKPRDAFGKIAKSSFHLLGTKVADNADITLDLRAKPGS